MLIEERGEVPVPGLVGAPAEDLADVRQVGAGGPDFLTRDPPSAAVGHGPGADRCQVRSGAGLAEQLAGDLLPAVEAGQRMQPLFLRPVPQDRGGDHAEAYRERGIAGTW